MPRDSTWVTVKTGALFTSTGRWNGDAHRQEDLAGPLVVTQRARSYVHVHTVRRAMCASREGVA